MTHSQSMDTKCTRQNIPHHKIWPGGSKQRPSSCAICLTTSVATALLNLAPLGDNLDDCYAFIFRFAVMAIAGFLCPVTLFPSRSRSKSHCSHIRKRPPRAAVEVHLAEAAGTLASQLVASCGVALAGLLGARATARTRALTAAKYAHERRREEERAQRRIERRAELSITPKNGIRKWQHVRADADDIFIASSNEWSADQGSAPFAPYVSAALSAFDRKLALVPSASVNDNTQELSERPVDPHEFLSFEDEDDL